MIKVNVFMRACLESSKPTPGFCDGVPGRTEFMKSIAWQQQQCAVHKLSVERQCGQLFQQVQQFCEQRGERGANANIPFGEVETDAPPPPPPPPAPTRPPRVR